jgi:hypothetical protein
VPPHVHRDTRGLWGLGFSSVGVLHGRLKKSLVLHAFPSPFWLRLPACSLVVGADALPSLFVDTCLVATPTRLLFRRPARLEASFLLSLCLRFVSLRASSSQRTCPQRVRLAGMLTSTSLLAQRPAGATRVIIGNRVQTPCPARMVPEFRLIALGGKLRPPPKTRPKVRKHTFMCEGTGWRLEARHNHRSIECMRFLSFGNRTYVQRCRASRRACIRHHHPPTYNMRHH